MANRRGAPAPSRWRSWAKISTGGASCAQRNANNITNAARAPDKESWRAALASLAAPYFIISAVLATWCNPRPLCDAISVVWGSREP
eukprot:3733704-Pyramimonas_sp.AAC.1